MGQNISGGQSEESRGRIPVSVVIGPTRRRRCPDAADSSDLDEMMLRDFATRAVEMVPAKPTIWKCRQRRNCAGGYVNLNEMRTEAVWRPHSFTRWKGSTGFHVECVTRRKEPIYLTTVVGPPPQEDSNGTRSRTRVFAGDEMQYRNCGRAMPRRDFSQLMIVAIRKSYPGTRENHECDLVTGQAMFTK